MATPSNIFSIKYSILANILSYKLNIIYFLLISFLLVILFFLFDKKRFLSFFKNYFPFSHLLFTLFLFFSGMALGYRIWPGNFDLNIFSILGTICLILSIALASMATKFAYNCCIKKEISVTDCKENKQIIGVVIILSLIGSVIISAKFFLLLLVYFILIFLYLGRPFKLSNFPYAAELVALPTTLIVLFTGYGLISDNQTIDHFPWRIGILLLFSTILFLHVRKIKTSAFFNEKKTESSRAAFDSKNRQRVIISTELFVFFIASVIILNEIRLFWWALVAGGASFWLILNENESIKKYISWFILLIIASYIIVAARIIFGF